MLWKFLLLLSLVHALVVAWSVISERRNPTSALAWLLAILFLPFVGVWLYWIIGRRRYFGRGRRMDRALDQAKDAAAPLAKGPDSSPLPGLVSVSQRGLVALATNIGDFPVRGGNDARVLADADQAYPEMEQAIARAQRFVHLEYYIFEPDRTGTRLRDALVQKARQGVEVRLLVDHVGSSRLGREFLAPLLEAGARFAFSLPTRLPNIFHLWRFNYRNHRKITIIDGDVAFTGGMNIGDNYLGRRMNLSPWRDMHLRIRGPAVLDLETVFAADWGYATGETIPAPLYYPGVRPAGNALVQIIPSGPDRRWNPIHKVFFEAIATAEERVYITSPYFVPDATILEALVTTALSGVDVRILLPGPCDLPLVRLAGRSYFEELLAAGVRIYEYQAGILHAKTLTVDGRHGTVGSANMDIRSFQLNFEINAFVYGEDLALALERVFFDDLAQAREVRLEDMEGRRWRARAPERLARLLSGLL